MERVHKPIYFANVNGDAFVSLKVVNCFKFTPGSNQTRDHQMPKKILLYCSKANIIKNLPEYFLRTFNLNLTGFYLL